MSVCSRWIGEEMTIRNMTVVKCDECGEQLNLHTCTIDEAKTTAKSMFGWIFKSDGYNYDYCHGCAKLLGHKVT